VTSIVFRHS